MMKVTSGFIKINQDNDDKDNNHYHNVENKKAGITPTLKR